MKADKVFIGVDSGTQGTKVVLFSMKQQRIVASAYAPHELIADNSGRREQEPRWWIDAAQTAIKSALQLVLGISDEVVAIGVSGQQHGMVPLDSQGHVIRPAKLWCDTETASQCEELTQILGGEKRVMELIGNPIAAGFTASKILWLKQNEPGHYERLSTVLLPHDYLNYWLTGNKVAEFGDASGTAYFDVRQRQWCPEVLNAIDPSGKLLGCVPELIESHAPAGWMRQELAAQFGLGPDIIVSSGGGDNMMGAIGTGNVSPGTVTLSLGTSGTIYSCADAPIIDPGGECAAFCSSTGQWLPLICTMNVTVSTELTRSLLSLDIDQLNRLASLAPPGAEGVVLIPFFNGERTPNLPNAQASWTGLTSSNFVPANLCRAALEGPTFGLRYGMEILNRQGIRAREIRLIGGGAKSPLWRQIVADVFGCPVVCPVSEEAGAMGAVLQSMWCYFHQNNDPVSIELLCKQWIALDESSRVYPSDQSEQYQQLYQDYVKRVNHLYR